MAGLTAEFCIRLTVVTLERVGFVTLEDCSLFSFVFYETQSHECVIF